MKWKSVVIVGRNNCFFLLITKIHMYSSMSENKWGVTVQNKMFDAKCVVAQEQFFSQQVCSIIGLFGVT